MDILFDWTLVEKPLNELNYPASCRHNRAFRISWSFWEDINFSVITKVTITQMTFYVALGDFERRNRSRNDNLLPAFLNSKVPGDATAAQFLLFAFFARNELEKIFQLLIETHVGGGKRKSRRKLILNSKLFIIEHISVWWRADFGVHFTSFPQTFLLDSLRGSFLSKEKFFASLFTQIGNFPPRAYEKV